MNAERIETALAELDPESRALVELSLIRDVADEDIASLLGTDESAVRSRRDDALAVLADDLGASTGEEIGALVSDIRALPAVRRRGAGEPAKRRRRLGPAVIGGILAAAVVALMLLLSGGDGDEGDRSRAEAPGQSASRPTKLAPVAGASGSGTARLNGNRLELSVTGLRDPGEAGYVVWLYDSFSKARPLNRAQSRSAFDLKAALPEGAARYRFVDVSLEPADSNDNHSGQSVLRVPLSELR